MSVSDLREKLIDLLFWILCPRAAREDRDYQIAREQRVQQRKQEAREKIKALRSDEEEWLKVACDPNTTADILRYVIANEVDSWHRVGGVASSTDCYADYDRISQWRINLFGKLAEHTNFPPDLIADLFESVGYGCESIADGLLRNPALPLILLEYPDFLERLDQNDRRGRQKNKYMVAHRSLQSEKTPSALIAMIVKMDDPWISLEAQTHINAEDSAVTGYPDIEWLDTQIIHILRSDTISERWRVHELGRQGLISQTIEPTVPWKGFNDSGEVVGGEVPTHPIVIEFLEEIDRLTDKEPEEREWYLHNLLLRFFQPEMFSKVAYLEAALFHPTAPEWVDTCIATGWRYGTGDHTVALHRLMTIKQGKATAAVKARHRFDAIGEIALCWWGTRGSSAGIFYLMMRALPEVLLEARSNPKYGLSVFKKEPLEHIESTAFLVRLAVALRLDDADPEHDEWREILCNDPNRYVRAAARREIAWPSRQ
ncbi:MAG: hypothetical protein QM758_07455 [Armatimonas sp.]